MTFHFYHGIEVSPSYSALRPQFASKAVRQQAYRLGGGQDQRSLPDSEIAVELQSYSKRIQHGASEVGFIQISGICVPVHHCGPHY